MKRKYILLSYPLTNDTYGYGENGVFKAKKNKSVSKGDSCNTYALNLTNHAGTHIDCPNHFYNSGKKVIEYKIEDFIFSKPVLLYCAKSTNELITEKDIKKNFKRLKTADMALFKTGFYRYRGSPEYSAENPGISPDAAMFIRMSLGNIRCIGIDAISVSPYRNRELGRKTHAIFLKDTFKNKPPCLIEDMKLSGRLDNLKTVYAIPLLAKDIDSAPCTVFGVLRNKR